MGDINGHHQEWLGSRTTNHHCVAAFDTVTGCDQLVVGPTHERGGTLDLLMTDLPDLRQANVTPIPTGPPSSYAANYRPISMTSVLSKVVERLGSVRVGRFIERSGVLPTTQFAYRKGLDTSYALLCVSHTLQSALGSGQEARIVQIYFSAAFDRVNH